MGVLWTIASGLCSGALGALLVLLLDFQRRPRSRFMRWTDALMLYLAKRAAQLLGAFQWRQYVKDSKQLEKVQEQFVLQQIRANAQSAYGRDHNFSGIASLAEFRRSQPLTTYADYESYISRAEQGDYSAIFGENRAPKLFGCSSGTTGKSKRIPVTERALSAFWQDRIGVLYGSHPEMMSADPLPVLTTFCAPRWRYTSAGVRIGSVMASVFDSKVFKMTITLPEAAMEVSREDAATYIGLLFGLRDADVEGFQGSFASGTFGMLQYLEKHWRQMVDDLRRGRLGEHVDVSLELRKKLDEHLQPLPQRADQLEKEFSKGFEGILPRIFPRLRSIFSSHSGSSMDVYHRRCLPYYGGVPVYSHIYVCTESLMGVDVRPCHERSGYALLPRVCYMEFLPVDEQGQPEPGRTPLEASEVKVGETYEVVLTNSSGFYRYRLGDIIEVVGFFNQVPLIDFLYRSGQILNVHFEKMTEASFTHALQEAVARWQDTRVDNFSVAESVLDTSSAADVREAPHYLLFLETSGAVPSAEQLTTIDEQLCAEHYVYKSFRVKNSIGPIQVMLVRAGTFRQYQEYVITTTETFLLQFKQPRVLRTPAQLEFFLQRRLTQGNH